MFADNRRHCLTFNDLTVSRLTRLVSALKRTILSSLKSPLFWREVAILAANGARVEARKLVGPPPIDHQTSRPTLRVQVMLQKLVFVTKIEEKDDFCAEGSPTLNG